MPLFTVENFTFKYMTSSTAAKDREKIREVGRVTVLWATLVAIAAVGLLFYGDTLASLVA